MAAPKGAMGTFGTAGADDFDADVAKALEAKPGSILEVPARMTFDEAVQAASAAVADLAAELDPFLRNATSIRLQAVENGFVVYATQNEGVDTMSYHQITQTYVFSDQIEMMGFVAQWVDWRRRSELPKCPADRPDAAPGAVAVPTPAPRSFSYSSGDQS